MVHQTISDPVFFGRRLTKRLFVVRASDINSRVQEVVRSVSCNHPQPRWHSRKRHDIKYDGCIVAGCLNRWEPWLLSGRRSGEQWAKDGRYQASVGLRSVYKRSSARQSGDCRSVFAQCSTVHRCLSADGYVPQTPMKLTDCRSIVARLCADHKIKKKKISYPERSLYFSFHCDTNKQTHKNGNNAKSICLETNSRSR